jgi:SAM-dependent methyltransferase
MPSSPDDPAATSSLDICGRTGTASRFAGVNLTMVASLISRCFKPVAQETVGHLDSPLDGQIVAGVLRVAGWIAGPGRPGGALELMVDDRPIRDAIHRLPRPDVEAAFKNGRRPGRSTGFAASVETSQFPDGFHRLSCAVRRRGRKTIIGTRTFQTRNTCARVRMARQYLRGSGIEIGALHDPLGLTEGCRVTYVDRMNTEDLRREYRELANRPLAEVGVVDDGEKLAKFADSSQDFVIANHFIEHAQDPIGTIKRHLDVLAPGGILFMAVPDKRETFDQKRPVTPLEHFFKDHFEGPQWSYMDHVREWVSLVAGATGDAFDAKVKQIVDTRYSIHFHVWTQNELLEFLVAIRRRLNLPFDIVEVTRNGHESIVILKKWTSP